MDPDDRFDVWLEMQDLPQHIVDHFRAKRSSGPHEEGYFVDDEYEMWMRRTCESPGCNQMADPFVTRTDMGQKRFCRTHQ